MTRTPDGGDPRKEQLGFKFQDVDSEADAPAAPAPNKEQPSDDHGQERFCRRKSKLKASVSVPACQSRSSSESIDERCPPISQSQLYKADIDLRCPRSAPNVSLQVSLFTISLHCVAKRGYKTAWRFFLDVVRNVAPPPSKSIAFEVCDVFPASHQQSPYTDDGARNEDSRIH